MFGDELNTGIQNLITWFLLPRRWNGPSCKLHLCPRGVGDSQLRELPYWEACQILLPGKVGLHSLCFRGVEMLYLFVTSHST